MNKKVMLFVGFCALSIFTWEAQAANYLSAPTDSGSEFTVIMQGCPE